MAQKFSDIMSNYQNMSVEELGTSLLGRQEQQRAAAAKSAKKSQKVQQALGVLLAGQAVFKNAFKRRQEELKELKTLDLLNVENDAKKIRGVADVMSVIPENYFPELDATERTDRFFSDRSLGNQFKNKLKPLIDTQLKSVYANTPDFSATPEYNSILDYGSREVLLNIFKDNKHDKFYNDLQTLDPTQTSREELFKNYLSISGQQLTQQKTRLYKEMENQLRGKSGVIGGVAGILKRISKDKEAEEELGLFSNITEKDIEGANLSEMLDSIDIIGTLMPSIDKAVSMTQLSPTRYRNAAMSQQNKAIRDRIGQTDFVDFMDDVSEDRVLDTFNLLSAVDTSKFERLNKYFVKNTGEKEAMVTDATALALRFQDDPQFAVDLYKTVTSDPKKIKQFASQIRDIEFRNKFALAMTIKAGARPGWRAGASEYIGTDLYMKDLDSQGYDPTLGYNNMTALVEDPIVIDSNGNFKANKDYTQLSNTQKLNIIDKKIDTIINSPISEDAKQKTIDNLFDNIDIPEMTNQEDYFNYRNKKDQTKDDQVKESLEAKIQRRIGELPEQTPAGAFISGDSRERGIRMEEISKFNKEKRQDFLKKKNTLIDEIRNINKEKTLPITRNLFTLPSEKEAKEIQDKNARYVTDLITEKYGIDTNTNNLQKISLQITDALKDNPEVYTEIMDIIQNKDNIEYLESLKDEKKKIRPEYINDEVLNLQRIHLEEKRKDGTPRFTYNSVEEAQDILNELTEFVLESESDKDFNAANPKSSARGGYQFLKDSVVPAVNRVESKMGKQDRFNEVRKTGDVRSLSESDQTLLFMGDILEKSGSDKYIQNLLDAKTPDEKRDAAYQIYAVLHHTLDSEGNIPKIAELQTKRKLKKYFNN